MANALPNTKSKSPATIASPTNFFFFIEVVLPYYTILLFYDSCSISDQFNTTLIQQFIPVYFITFIAQMSRTYVTGIVTIKGGLKKSQIEGFNSNKKT